MKDQSFVTPHTAALLLAALLFPSLSAADYKGKLQIQPEFVMQVAETTALGYGNGRKLISDPNGTMYFSAVSKAPNGYPGVCVIRTAPKKEGAAAGFEKVWIENSNGVVISANMHFATSLGAYGAGPFYVVWAGGDQTKSNDPKLAHQIRWAQITTEGPMKVADVGQPFTITGFDEAYRQPYLPSQYWQEFPSAFVSKDGKLHVVWEARNRKRRAPNDVPVPGIAYAVRGADGKWSVTGEIDTPPFLDVKTVAGAQYRPFMATDDSGVLHVVCYGEVHNRLQILHGKMDKGVFSGWKQISSSPNDQRHASIVIDGQGRVHAAWREGGRARQQAVISYSMLGLDGIWTPAIRVGDSSRHGSTPNITVDDKAAYIVWTGWAEGFENSDNQKNNGFPNDNDTVEGQLEFAFKKFEEDQFSTPVYLSGGVGSYPRVARMKTTPSKLAVIWTLGSECQPQSCVQVNYSELTPP